MLKILGCYALTAMQENNNEEKQDYFYNFFITLERDHVVDVQDDIYAAFIKSVLQTKDPTDKIIEVAKLCLQSFSDQKKGERFKKDGIKAIIKWYIWVQKPIGLHEFINENITEFDNSKKLTKWLKNTLPKTIETWTHLFDETILNDLVNLIPSEIIQNKTRLYIKDNKKKQSKRISVARRKRQRPRCTIS